MNLLPCKLYSKYFSTPKLSRKGGYIFEVCTVDLLPLRNLDLVNYGIFVVLKLTSTFKIIRGMIYHCRMLWFIKYDSYVCADKNLNFLLHLGVPFPFAFKKS